MSDTSAGPIHLRRIDPAQNMRRFYILAVQPTLFGGASVIRSWGRIGTNGQSMMETVDRAEAADAAFLRLERTKRMRIPTLSGRAFQPEAGHRSDVKPATIPINIRPL